MGGDARITCDPKSGLNNYGCPPFPQPQVSAYGSCTASTISQASFAAAQALQVRLESMEDGPDAPKAIEKEFERLRNDLAEVFAVASLTETAIIFGPSGTDLHLIAAQLSGSGPLASANSQPLLVATLQASETGNGVPSALAARHYSARAAMAGAVRFGESLSGACGTEIIEVQARNTEGYPLPSAEIDSHLESMVERAASSGRRMMLIISDVSKTGLLAPSPSSALRMLHRYPTMVDVLVDACQFRLSPATLRSYLELGFLIAVSGSKFVTGPAFSGALLVPPSLARRWKHSPLPASLRAYCARADWPQDWAARESMHEQANYGLLLRWEAALAELRAFQALDQFAVAQFLRDFASTVQAKLSGDPSFETLALPALDRSPLVKSDSWDSVPTIFPFLLRRSTCLSQDQTMGVYKALLAQGWQIGQPAHFGTRYGNPVSALRLCASMRLAVDALSPHGRGSDAVIAGAIALLDKAVTLF